MSELIAFTLIAFLLVASPGPNGVLILKTVSSHGKSSGIANILGLTSATFLHGAFSIFGLSALLLQSAELFLVVKIIGAAYLFYIGFKAIKGSFSTPQNKGATSTATPLKQQEQRSPLYFFSEGFITQLLNPKVSMFYLAAFPQFIAFDNTNYVDAFLLVAIHAGIIFFWFLGMTQLVGKIKQVAQTSNAGRWVQRTSGTLLMYFGGALLTQEGHVQPIRLSE
ncbi:LysE family translocator [Litoribacillus peritrichatus]|uniref:LysE family translocator n=1 Tax=Litoribacillus peritrichatus TaxID=718191 RepID=A0ABP7NA41_9GAMM